MTKEIIAQRRTFHRRRFISGIVQLSLILAATVFNCVAELFFPALLIPISFYVPQFTVSMAARLSLPDSTALFALLIAAAAIVVILLALSLILSRRNYRVVNLISVIVSVDIILLIYVAMQSLILNGFDAFFVINLFVHVWMLALSIAVRRSSEGLDVLPENPEPDDEEEA